MKEKTVKTDVVQPVAEPTVEKLGDSDKMVLDLAKMKKELAMEKAKTALAQNESAELAYNNVILQLALKYKLVDNDIITETGEIQRKTV